MRAHRLFVQDDVATLRAAQQHFATLDLDPQFCADAALLGHKVEQMLLIERRDQGSAEVPRFTREDLALLERLATRLAEANQLVAARHWRSLLSSVREDLLDGGQGSAAWQGRSTPPSSGA